MNRCVIPTNFRIPASVKDRWMFVSRTIVMEIRRNGVKSIQLKKASCMGMSDGAQRDHSRSLDWMQEAVEELRRICNA